MAREFRKPAAIGAVLMSILVSACAAPERRVAGEMSGAASVVCDQVPEAPQDPLEQALANLVTADCASLAPAFMASLADAAMVESEEIVDTLRTVPDRTGRLKTRQAGDRTQMLVTIWTDAASAARFYTPGPVRQAPPGAPRIWVTLAPELQDWCRSALGWPDRTVETQAMNALRINQRLGIPPFSMKSRFAELWVDQDGGVIRPCADPNPALKSCGTAFPQAINQPGITAESYFRWFGDNVGYSYTPTGAPWTRLGYTYDWAPDNRSSPPTGASEFMLSPGSSYQVHEVYTLLQYCGP